MKKAPVAVVGVLAIGGLIAGAWLWSRSFAPGPPGQAAPVATAPPVAAAPPEEPAIQHPLDLSAVQPSAAPLDLTAAFTDLLGPKAVRSLFRLDDFAHRFVATADNLGRSHAPSRLWPVQVAAGRFTVDGQGDALTASADNGSRYTPYVLLLETVDLRQAAALYMQLYPQLQQAYEEMGFPKRYFNDRLVAVIDLLLATPQPSAPPKVRLPAIVGPVQPARPWLLYEFEDPALQSLSSGQRILLRMGPVNEQRVKARLAEFRSLVTAGVPAR
jgi:hypothetical protein